MKEKGRKLYETLFFLCGRLGCHQMPNRSFYIKGYQLPLCARCTGVVIGYALGLILGIFIAPPMWLAGVLLLPMAIDWGLQTGLKKESTNGRRFIVGLFGGVGIIIFFGNLFGLY